MVAVTFTLTFNLKMILVEYLNLRIYTMALRLTPCLILLISHGLGVTSVVCARTHTSG